MKATNHKPEDMRGLIGTAQRLAVFADLAQPRPDWHEPDEQGITVAVKGKKLDNAFGDDGTGFDGEQYEKVVVLRCSDTGQEERLNLASLLALATYGARMLVLKPTRQAEIDEDLEVHVWSAYLRYGTISGAAEDMGLSVSHAKRLIERMKARRKRSK